MNILVTGGCGFIGSHLVKRLYEDGHNITVIDSLARGKIENIKDLINYNKIRFIRSDITYSNISSILKNIDIIFHLAALIDVEESIINPIAYYHTNYYGTINLLNIAKKNGIKKFVFASSAAVYGNPIELPLKEHSRTIPINPYGRGKLLAEDYIKCFSRENIKCIILRLFNVYGPKDNSSSYSGVIQKFMNNAMNNKPLTIYGTGSQTRDFVYVSDVVNAFMLTLEYDDNDCFNIGIGKPVSISNLAYMVKDIVRSDVKIEYEEERYGDIKHSYADISRAVKFLGYKVNVDIKHGLRLLYDSLCRNQ